MVNVIRFECPTCGDTALDDPSCFEVGVCSGELNTDSDNILIAAGFQADWWWTVRCPICSEVTGKNCTAQTGNLMINSGARSASLDAMRNSDPHPSGEE